MSAIADLELPVADAGLGTVFDDVPSLTCEMEQVIASGNRTLWLSGDTQSSLDSALAESPVVTDYTLVGTGEGRWLYDVAFTDDIIDVFGMAQSEDGTILRATASDRSWNLRIRFPERENISGLFEQLREDDIPVSIHRLAEASTELRSGYGLTEQQYKTLVAAIDHGYFEIPREVSMQELSDKLEISHQALSERLRRAYRTLVVSELEVSQSDPSSPSITTN